MLAYTGLPGSGKSYSVVENVIVPALKEKRQVWTNIPCKNDNIFNRFGARVHQFDLDDIESNPDWFQDVLPKGAVVIIDEAQLIWPNGLKVSNVNPQHKSFFTEYRHMVGEDGFSTTPVIVTQDLANVANFIRSLVKFTYRSTDMSALGMPHLFRVDVYQGPAVGPSPPQSKRLRELGGKFKQDIYDLYVSHTKSEFGAGKESSVDQRFNVLAGAKLKTILLTLVAGVVAAVWGLKSVYGYYESGGKKPTQPVTSTHNPHKPKRVDYVNPYHQSDYLNGRDVHIVFNMGKGSDIRYVFEVSSRKDWYQIDVFQLKKLGYSVTMINECLVIIENKTTGYSRPASCKNASDDGLLNWSIKSDEA